MYFIPAFATHILFNKCSTFGFKKTIHVFNSIGLWDIFPCFSPDNEVAVIGTQAHAHKQTSPKTSNHCVCLTYIAPNKSGDIIRNAMCVPQTSAVHRQGPGIQSGCSRKAGGGLFFGWRQQDRDNKNVNTNSHNNPQMLQILM